MTDGATAVDADVVPDPELLGARAQARHALEEITDASSIGAEAGYEAHEERVVTLFFESRLSGYPGWRWAATLARVDADSPVNVLEVELVSGEDSVVAPDWVPWSERLAQFRESQAQAAVDEATAAETAATELSDEDDAEDDLLNNDFSDFDDEIDGVDIDPEDGDDDDSDDDDSDDDDSDDDDSDDDIDEDPDGDEDSDDLDDLDDSDDEDSEDK